MLIKFEILARLIIVLISSSCGSALGSNNFSGTLPPELGNLHNLALMYVSLIVVFKHIAAFYKDFHYKISFTSWIQSLIK